MGRYAATTLIRGHTWVKREVEPSIDMRMNFVSGALQNALVLQKIYGRLVSEWMEKHNCRVRLGVDGGILSPIDCGLASIASKDLGNYKMAWYFFRNVHDERQQVWTASTQLQCAVQLRGPLPCR